MALTRERLIQTARVAVIDDESPLVIDELRKHGGSVEISKEGKYLRGKHPCGDYSGASFADVK